MTRAAAAAMLVAACGASPPIAGPNVSPEMTACLAHQDDPIVASSTPDHVKRHMVSPKQLTRTEGRLSPEPDVPLLDQLRHDGVAKLRAAYIVCIDETGAVVEATQLRGSCVRRYDDSLDATIHAWRYQPYLENGQPTSACIATQFALSVR